MTGTQLLTCLFQLLLQQLPVGCVILLAYVPVLQQGAHPLCCKRTLHANRTASLHGRYSHATIQLF